MTQDQCLDNDHQATSNNQSTNDQVSDDLNNSKNSIVSNGVNSVQEFNVDVNSKPSENRADVAIVQNRALDGDSRPSGKVLKASEQLACTSNNIASSNEILSNCVIAIDGNKRESANNILLTDMTVIKHQNSSENIRDIIANSNQANKDPGDSQITEVVNNVNSEQKLVNASGVHKSGETRRKIKSELSVNGEIDKPEDPIERLNKLRASISNALSEVKGVLKQYSTEQSFDGENESTPSSEPTDDAPVRFRFVRKIRRRSAYTEDDDASQKQAIQSGTQQTENTTKYADNSLKNILEDSSRENKPAISISFEQKKSNEERRASNELSATCSPKDASENTEKLVSETQQEVTNLPPEVKELSSDHVSAPIAESHGGTSDVKTSAAEQANPIASRKTKQSHLKKQSSTDESSAAIKTKSGKPKKIVKKDRRASIAAVEVNQAPTDTSIPNLELKTQRRPSDSGTLVKQPSIGKHKSKTGEKVKVSNRQAKVSSVLKIEVPAATGPSESINQSGQPLVIPLRSGQPEGSTLNTNLQTPIENEVSTTQQIPRYPPFTDNVVIESHESTTSKTPVDDKLTQTIESTKPIEPLIEINVPIVTEPSVQNNTTQTTEKTVSLDKVHTPTISQTPVPGTIDPTQHQVETTAHLIKTEVPILTESNSVHNETAQITEKTVSIDKLNIPTNDKAPIHDTIESFGTTATKDVAIIGTGLKSVLSEPTSAIEKLSSLEKSNKPTISQTPILDSIESTQNQVETAPIVKAEVPIIGPESTSVVANDTTPTAEQGSTIHDTIDLKQHQVKTVPFSETEVHNVAEQSNKSVSIDKLQEPTNNSVSPAFSTLKALESTQNNNKIPTSSSATELNEPVAVKSLNVKAINSKSSTTEPNDPVAVKSLKVKVINSKSSTTASNEPVAVKSPKDKAINSKSSSTESNEPVAVKSPKAKASNSKLLNKSENKADSTEKDKNVKLPAVKLPEVDQIKPTADKTIETGQTQISSASEAAATPQSNSEDPKPAEDNNSASTSEATLDVEPAPPKKKKKAKRKVVIRRIKRKLSKDDTFIQIQEAPPVLEIEEKEIEENDDDDEDVELVPKQRKSCLKARQFEIGDIVMYAERYKKTQVKWKKGTVLERITSISYKLEIDGEEKPAHISYIKKFTNRKVNFGGKEYLEIDYAQIEEDEEKERTYSIWNLV